MIFSKRYLITASAAAMMTFLSGCEAGYENEYDYTSPSGEKTVTVKVDHVSRPDVYYNDECIFEYDRPGFTETVRWNVEWISENSIRLYLSGYDDEEYIISIPKE